MLDPYHYGQLLIFVDIYLFFFPAHSHCKRTSTYYVGINRKRTLTDTHIDIWHSSRNFFSIKEYIIYRVRDIVNDNISWKYLRMTCWLLLDKWMHQGRRASRSNHSRRWYWRKSTTMKFFLIGFVVNSIQYHERERSFSFNILDHWAIERRDDVSIIRVLSISQDR